MSKRSFTEFSRPPPGWAGSSTADQLASKPKLRFDNTFLFDVLIVGGGPAGLSAALALCRVKRTAAVFDDERYRTYSASLSHNFLTRDRVSPADIRAYGRADIDRYGTTNFVGRSLVHARKDEMANVFEVEDAEGDRWRGCKLIIAAGSTAVFPPHIEGYAENWGSNIYQCLFSNGLERSDRAAGVLTCPKATSLYGVSALFQLGCPSVTIFTNGPLTNTDGKAREALKVARQLGAIVDERRIQRFAHAGDTGIEIVFVDGQSVRVGFLSHQPPTVANAAGITIDLAIQLIPDGTGGTMIERSEPFGETNVPGVFSAGDASTPLKQITTAMHHGVLAGVGAHQQMIDESNEALAASLRGINASVLAQSLQTRPPS
ncbi:FAD/NAD(P)-binding domain-containing protein [Polychaeton citri CBS 116435]|uniref:FAD/NAD(P)-binding domain-containing protein n=1 Tax=Polychaeton citri CBS 116435 TaxID=1314669 RepID=A0A9P4QA44_9PEZI|nr:FAD/NAD(P)-binding domain-containing protein [Polychaeton citri CBS 116435]